MRNCGGRDNMVTGERRWVIVLVLTESCSDREINCAIIEAIQISPMSTRHCSLGAIYKCTIISTSCVAFPTVISR